MKEYRVKYCSGLIDLHDFIDKVNYKRYEIVTMTVHNGGYTIIYTLNN